jgi:hypothetical protein
MKVGRIWAGNIENIPVRVEYTRHFVDRFEKDEGDRPAVDRYMNEPEVLEVIKDALPGITKKWKTIWDHSGVITSKGRDLNMSFITDTDQDGMKVVMKNMMLKPAYHARPNDYVFAVAGTKDPELGMAVADHLASMAGRHVLGRVETPETVFSVARQNGRLRVSGATWMYDTYVYPVR